MIGSQFRHEHLAERLAGTGPEEERDRRLGYLAVVHFVEHPALIQVQWGLVLDILAQRSFILSALAEAGAGA